GSVSTPVAPHVSPCCRCPAQATRGGCSESLRFVVAVVLRRHMGTRYCLRGLTDGEKIVIRTAFWRDVLDDRGARPDTPCSKVGPTLPWTRNRQRTTYREARWQANPMTALPAPSMSRATSVGTTG